MIYMNNDVQLFYSWYIWYITNTLRVYEQLVNMSHAARKSIVGELVNIKQDTGRPYD